MIARLIRWATTGMVVMNVALWGVYYLLASQNTVYRLGSQFPAIAGVGFTGDEPQVRPQRCSVIRMTADDCEFCKQDAPAYSAIARAARKKGCDIIAIAPVAGQMAPTAGDAHQLKLVPMALGAALYPYITPQTVLLDAERRTVWQQIGVTDAKALGTAIEAIERLQGN